MRRGVASLIMGLSLLVASASWAGFVLSHTVLDPGRSERLADHLLDSPEVRSAIVSRVADAMEAQIPAGIPVPRQTLELAATLALNDPQVETLIRDGIVRAHQNALNGIDEPVNLDATVLGQSARDALVGEVPALDLLLPQSPSLAVEVPTAGLSRLGALKSFVDRFTLIGAVVALVGIVTAFVLARNRPAALRRVAFWAFASCAFWLAVAFGLPAAVGAIAPSAMAIASAAVDVFAGAMITPALSLGAVGVALLIASFLWPAMERRRPAAMLDSGAQGRNRSRSAPARRSMAAQPPVGGGGFQPAVGRQQPPQQPAYHEPAYEQPMYQQAPYRPRPETTQEYPVIVSGAAGGYAPPEPDPNRATPPQPVWVEGSGYGEGQPQPENATNLLPDIGEDPTLSAPVVNDRGPNR